jgi:hypothetical protein
MVRGYQSLRSSVPRIGSVLRPGDRSNDVANLPSPTFFDRTNASTVIQVHPRISQQRRNSRQPPNYADCGVDRCETGGGEAACSRSRS